VQLFGDFPASAVCDVRLRRMTVAPAVATTSAMPLPIIPEPTMPTF
jgi:hypothetical protein